MPQKGLFELDDGKDLRDSIVQVLIEHGRRKGFLTHRDIIACVPGAEFDEELMGNILRAVAEAEIPVVDNGDEDEKPPKSAFDDELAEAGDIGSEAPVVDEDIQDTQEPEAQSEHIPLTESVAVDDLAGIETGDMVRLYVREASRAALLTAEEEVDLARRIELGALAQQELSRGHVRQARKDELLKAIDSGRQARERLIRSNARLVISVAKKYIGRGLPFLDLIQEGNIGLMRAIRHFEYRRGFKFSTYATWWIRQAITRALAEQGRTIRLPVHMSDQVNRMMREQSQLQGKLGRSPTVDELAEALGVPPSKVEQLMDIVRQPLSLQMPVGEDEEEALGDFIEDVGAPDPEETVTQLLMNEDLRKRLEALPGRELEVLSLRYGLEGGTPLTLTEVGRRLGITRERARQLEVQAIDRLRNPERVRRRGRKPKER